MVGTPLASGPYDGAQLGPSMVPGAYYGPGNIGSSVPAVSPWVPFNGASIYPAGQVNTSPFPSAGKFIFTLFVFGVLGAAIYMSRAETDEEKAYWRQRTAQRRH